MVSALAVNFQRKRARKEKKEMDRKIDRKAQREKKSMIRLEKRKREVENETERILPTSIINVYTS